jgi:hypothetical protein
MIVEGSNLVVALASFRITAGASGQKRANRRSSKGTKLSLRLFLVVGLLPRSCTGALTRLALGVEALGGEEATLMSRTTAKYS